MIAVPARLSELLEKDQKLSGVVRSSLAAFDPILSWNALPFFPEYTDHGTKHIEDVLRTADYLIHADSWKYLTPTDSALLILAILLHDLGMHISEDGFYTLIASQKSRVVTTRIDQLKWPDLWERFLAEARRWDGRKLVKLFGTTEPISRPPADKLHLTLKDRLFIGEFLRRHHARLAHEIALIGLPGTESLRLTIASSLDYKVRDLGGLIARSHGMPLRSLLPHLSKDFDLRDYQGAHPLFLMALLRIADYLQIQAGRAPREHSVVFGLRSPISRQEWKVHQAVENIHVQHEDPEAVSVKALPTNVDIYIKLRDLISDMQKELDLTWAVLGEVYGRYDLANLRIKIRRVRSNIEDVGSFAGEINYVPIEARFETADADLLALLVGPLYGNNPTIGVRELIQNAADACLELEDFISHLKRDRPQQPTQNSDICVHISGNDKSGYVLTVSDKGIGMTVDVVRNYYLKAGASYRRSSTWKELHEEPSGSSRVLRSGRFGVGALATFLLGDELKVTTRHVGDSEGVEFVAQLETDPIELRRIRCPVGTTISIKLSPTAAMKLLSEIKPYAWSSEWGKLPSHLYVLTSPSLQILLNDVPYGRTLSWPAAGGDLPTGWHRLKVRDFLDVHWRHGHGQLACNGIAVGSYSLMGGYYEHERDFCINAPDLSVFDPDGKLPLKLTRDGLSSELPFRAQLIKEAVKDVLSHIMLDPWPQLLKKGDVPDELGILRHAAAHSFDNTGYVCFPHGFTLLDPELLAQANIKTLVCLGYGHPKVRNVINSDRAAVLYPRGYLTLTGADRWARRCLEAVRTKRGLWKLPVRGVRIHAEELLAARWLHDRKIPLKLLRTVRAVQVAGKSILTYGDCGASVIDWTAADSEELRTCPMIVEVHFGAAERSEIKSPIGQAVMEILRGPLIPYDRPNADPTVKAIYEELEPYLKPLRAAHEAKKQAGVTRV